MGIVLATESWMVGDTGRFPNFPLKRNSLSQDSNIFLQHFTLNKVLTKSKGTFITVNCVGDATKCEVHDKLYTRVSSVDLHYT